MELREAYPNLFAPTDWGPVHVKFEARGDMPDEELICNVNVVPFVGDPCLIIRLANGDWEIPGGTKEPGETSMDAIRRELIEEAGAQLLSFDTIGAWLCHSSDIRPWKPHLPHPDFYRLAGYGQVEIVGRPLNPDGGEEVVMVEVVTVDEAVRRFSDRGREDLAELYRLADAARREKLNAE